MQVKISRFATQKLSYASWCETSRSWVKDVAPQSTWEVEFSFILTKSVWVNSELQSWAKHDVILRICISINVIWEGEEERIIEWSSSVETIEHELCVIVSNEMIFVSYCNSHHICVAVLIIISNICKNIRLLWNLAPIIVISWKGIESSNIVPSETEFGSGIFNESTDICSNKWNSKHVHEHGSNNWKAHVLHLWEIITKPFRSVFAHSCKRTSWQNKSSFSLLFKPIMSNLDFSCAKEVMSIKLEIAILFCIYGHSFNVEVSVCRNVFQLFLYWVICLLTPKACTPTEITSLIHI